MEVRTDKMSITPRDDREESDIRLPEVMSMNADGDHS